MSANGAARAVIFDVDGTLVDTNDSHVEAWERAFREIGYDVSRDQIVPEVGKGGDNLVPTIIGEDGERRDGEALRKAHDRIFFEIADASRFPVFAGSEALIAELRRRGLRTAIATSSGGEGLDHTFRSAGVDFRELVDLHTNADDAESSKPDPDIVVAAVRKLGVDAGECLMVGDTTHDAVACKRAGVPFIAVLCGGGEADGLRSAGARGVWRDPADVLANLDAALGAVGAGSGSR